MMKNRLHFPIPNPALDVRIATNRRELIGAFELVYRCYLAKGYIRPHPGGIVYQPTFGLPSSRTVIATAQAEKIVGTLTVSGDNPLGLRLETTYPSEVQSLRRSSRKLAEITCLAIEPTDEFRPTAVYFALTRFMIHYAYWRSYDHLLIAIHPRHQSFYSRCFGADRLGPCRAYGVVNGSPAVLCSINLHNLRHNANPDLWQQYFAKELPEARHGWPPIKPADHRYFCSRQGIAPDADYSGYSVRVQDAA